MKIDLHLHTKTIDDKNSGEPKTRNIEDYNEFIEKLHNANIGIAAITNHNFFDKEYFIKVHEKIISSNKDILILPGVELDIFCNDAENNISRRQLNLIFNYNKNNKYEEIDIPLLDKFKILLDNFNNSDKNIENLLSIFSKLETEILLYLDVKSNNTNLKRWSDEEIKDLKEKIKLKNDSKFGVICDVNNKYSLLRYRSRGLQTLIGSDVRDWNKYEEESEKLLDISLKSVKSFSVFLKIFVFPESNQEVFDNLFKNDNDYEEIKDIKIKINNNQEVNVGDIKIYEGINIIFGSRASGKTLILEQIKEKTKDKNIFYDPSELNNKNDDYIKKLLSKFDHKSINDFKNKEANNYKCELSEKIQKIINFEDKKSIEFKKIIESISSKEIKIVEYFKSDHISNNEREKIKPLIEAIENLNNSYKKLKEFYKNSKEKILYEIKDISSKLLSSYIKENKKIWKCDLYKNIYNAIETKYMLVKGKQVKIDTIFLFDRWNNRHKLKETINEIKKNKWSESKCIQTKIKLEDRGEIYIKIELQTYDFNSSENKKINEIGLGVTDFNDIQSKIFNEKRKINEIVNNIESYKEKLKSFIQNPFAYKFLLLDNEQKEFSPSNGEKAILSLYINLNQKEKEFYLLDEPETYLNVSSIFNILIKQIWEKNKLKKKIVICTHNPALAINSIPYNMIYREKNNKDSYDTYMGNALTQKFINIKNNKDEINFSELLLSKFEDKEEYFNLRGEIYRYGKNRN